jgi:hypothetical protein
LVLNPIPKAFDILNGRLVELDRTGYRKEWGFDGWPLLAVAGDKSTQVFGGKRLFSYQVEVELYNSGGYTESKTITIESGSIAFISGSNHIKAPAGYRHPFSFTEIRSSEREGLAIKIISVDGKSVEEINETGYIRLGKVTPVSIKNIAAEAKADAAASEDDRQLGRYALANQFFETSGDGINQIVVNGYAGDIKYTLYIPKYINSKLTSRIADGAFEGKGVASLILTDNITYIGSTAFRNNSLAALRVPASVIEIGAYSFAANKIQRLRLPASVMRLGEGAFQSNEITTLALPNSLSEIGAFAFQRNRIRALDLPNSLTSLGAFAFFDNALRRLRVPDHLATISASAFRKNRLRTLVIPDCVTRIEELAFTENNLAEIRMPANVELSPASFDNDFVKYYDAHGKKEGKYTYKKQNWSRKPSRRAFKRY